MYMPKQLVFREKKGSFFSPAHKNNRLSAFTSLFVLFLDGEKMFCAADYTICAFFKKAMTDFRSASVVFNDEEFSKLDVGIPKILVKKAVKLRR